MWMSPSTILFILLIILSNLMVTSSPNLLLSWVALELNTLSFIPLILSAKHKMSSEVSVKYFLTQTIASVIFLIACLTQNLPFSINYLFSFLIIMALSIKLGAAPFHSWVPSVANSLLWVPFYFFLTLQKINPLIILGNSIKADILFFSITCASLIIGAFQGLAHTQIRLLLMFSSINHIGWMYTALMSSLKLMFMYFIFYMILLAPIIIMMNSMNYTHINQLSYNNFKPSFQLILFLNLLSLGGLPPFLGFLPKWFILQNLIENSSVFIPSLMIFMSLVTLYFYLRLTFSAFIMSNSKWFLHTFLLFKIKISMILMTMISLSGLLVVFLC